MNVLRLICICIFGATLSGLVSSAEPIFSGAVAMPNIIIDGVAVKIHTQGLYLTDDDYFVTGRVDTPPRRPVMLRILRGNPQHYQVLDLSDKPGLDHPGGFDRDDAGVFWIPVSTSHPLGPTTVVGVTLIDGKLPADISQVTKSFAVTDHLGALCCLPDRRLLGASWDTKTIYVIDSASGKIENALPQQAFFGGEQSIHLAVQDWKYDRQSQQVIVGGIDKSTGRPADESRAVVAWIEPNDKRIVSIVRLQPRDDIRRPLTNEGLAWFSGHLFLLPGDFGMPPGNQPQVLEFQVR